MTDCDGSGNLNTEDCLNGIVFDFLVSKIHKNLIKISFPQSSADSSFSCQHAWSNKDYVLVCESID